MDDMDEETKRELMALVETIKWRMNHMSLLVKGWRMYWGWGYSRLPLWVRKCILDVWNRVMCLFLGHTDIKSGQPEDEHIPGIHSWIRSCSFCGRNYWG